MWPRRLRVCTALSQNIHSLQLSKLNAGTKERKTLKCLDFVNILSLIYLVIQIHILVARLLNGAFTLSLGIMHGTTLCSNKGFSYMRMSKISSWVAHIFKQLSRNIHIIILKCQSARHFKLIWFNTLQSAHIIQD